MVERKGRVTETEEVGYTETYCLSTNFRLKFAEPSAKEVFIFGTHVEGREEKMAQT